MLFRFMPCCFVLFRAGPCRIIMSWRAVSCRVVSFVSCCAVGSVRGCAGSVRRADGSRAGCAGAGWEAGGQMRGPGFPAGNMDAARRFGPGRAGMSGGHGCCTERGRVSCGPGGVVCGAALHGMAGPAGGRFRTGRAEGPRLRISVIFIIFAAVCRREVYGGGVS